MRLYTWEILDSRASGPAGRRDIVGMVLDQSPFARALRGEEAPGGCPLGSTPRRAWAAYARRPRQFVDTAVQVAVRVEVVGRIEGRLVVRRRYSGAVRMGRAGLGEADIFVEADRG